MNFFPSVIRSLHYVNRAIITFMLFTVFVPTLTLTPKNNITISIVHSKLDYVTLSKPSSPKFTQSLIAPSDMLHLSSLEPVPSSLRIPRTNCLSPQRLSFEHAGLTCCTLLSPSITFHCCTLSFFTCSTIVCFCFMD